MPIAELMSYQNTKNGRYLIAMIRAHQLSVFWTGLPTEFIFSKMGRSVFLMR